MLNYKGECPTLEEMFSSHENRVLPSPDTEVTDYVNVTELVPYTSPVNNFSQGTSGIGYGKGGIEMMVK